MEIPLNFVTYAQWSGIVTLVCFLLAIIAFWVGWGIRFRLVGVTGFMGVLTLGIFGLGLGLLTRNEVAGAGKFSLVYNNGTNQAVISLPPNVTPSEVEATLQQAANDLFSYEKGGEGNNQFTIRARTLIHLQPGVSAPLYLGQIERTLQSRSDNTPTIEIFPESFARLPQ